MSLARPEDLDLLPAWLGIDVTDDPTEDPWPPLVTAVVGRSTAEVLTAADGLGLAVAALPAVSDSADATFGDLPVGWDHVGDGAPPARSVEGLRVVDLSSLWAGPLCGALLADLGADVVKVESTTRPDGARTGPPAFFDLLNAGKRSVALDLTAPAGKAALAGLVADADVVIEGSRPRALRAMGIDAREVLVASRTRTWISITGHGRAGRDGDRSRSATTPRWRAGSSPGTTAPCSSPTPWPIRSPGSWRRRPPWRPCSAVAPGSSMLRCPEVAASMAGPGLAVPDGTEAAAPHARPSRGAAPALGAHTVEVLGALA